ncbi:MAG: hypothetical protein WCV99_08430 [Sterolibacterium sp.]
MPSALESPELVPSSPVGALKTTFCPDTGARKLSMTDAVSVVEFEPSVLIDSGEAPRSSDNDDAVTGIAISPVTLVPTTSAETMSVWSVWVAAPEAERAE